ncbi:unnamed protein product [Rhizoctonia solani]|uniref:Uncharacterized protein n=1 Tax=Rhizoctonia solani TaxID=456999 RepID=A0A8H3HUC0_9AGAM|nr:unnamed protein product [Rhizoctonia solani]
MILLWDIGVATLCLTSSAYLYLLRHQRNNSLVSAGPPSAGYILTNQVVHARLLPVESKHAFTYQTMSLLLSVSTLEKNALNCGWRGVIFGYPGIWGRMTGLRPRNYLSDYPELTTIRQRLIKLLRPSDIKLGEVWMMTMPSFMGFEGINPLTVYFCYEEGRTTVWGIVLEVHNTFGERHAYVLQIGKGEDSDDNKSKGYDHQWTFARQFHVSPFNDRSGHYVCSVIMPSHPPPSIALPSPSHVITPRPVIRLHLLTASPSPQIKLVALLRPTISEPLTALNLLATLVLPPRGSRSPSSAHLLSAIPEPAPGPWSALPLGAALLLTSLRIIYQAALLHYQRGLAVFARPEPVAGPGREWVEKALGGVWNDIQPSNTDESTLGGSICWQSESPTERWGRKRFEEKMRATANKMGIKLHIASTNPLVPVVLLGSQESGRELILCYRSPRVWSTILVAPTASHALELGFRTERWFSVSDDSLFEELWDNCSSPNESGRILRIVGSIRARLAYLPTSARTITDLPQPPYRPHPLDSPPSFSLLAHVCLLYITFHTERLVFRTTGARFVKGDAPWRVWERMGRRPRFSFPRFLLTFVVLKEMPYGSKTEKMFFVLAILLWMTGVTTAWTIPNIDLPTYTYQCMPMELNWYDGSPPYSVWFRRGLGDGAETAAGLGAWHNLTGTNYLVPCIAPAGSRLELVLQDSTGWISTSRGNFVVLPSTDSSCLNRTSDAAGLSQSQSTLSTVLQKFQQSVISAISVSATASLITTVVIITNTPSSTSSVASSTAIPTEWPNSGSASRILGPVLGSLLAVLLCIAIGICFIRRRRQRKPEAHIPLNSTSAFDLLDGEESNLISRSGSVTREISSMPSVIQQTNTETNVNAVAVPRARLRLHDEAATGWPSTVKNRESAVPPLPGAAEQALPTPTIPEQDQRTLEQRAEQLSAPELERLAALVARRLERVRGAPPQYQATEGIGV